MKYLELIGAVILGIIVLIYMALAISWSDADYCRQNISPETTCREHYTLWNWLSLKRLEEMR